MWKHEETFSSAPESVIGVRPRSYCCMLLTKAKQREGTGGMGSGRQQEADLERNSRPGPSAGPNSGIAFRKRTNTQRDLMSHTRITSRVLHMTSMREVPS